jgi:hypothetical protein
MWLIDQRRIAKYIVLCTIYYVLYVGGLMKFARLHYVLKRKSAIPLLNPRQTWPNAFTIFSSARWYRDIIIQADGGLVQLTFAFCLVWLQHKWINSCCTSQHKKVYSICPVHLQHKTYHIIAPYMLIYNFQL